MRILIDNKHEADIDLENGQIKAWWEELCSEINKADRFIYSVSIDNQPVYDLFDKHIENNLINIDELNVQTKTKQESAIETTGAISDYLERFIPAITELSDHFYGELTEENWGTFSYFIEGLSWILQSIEFLQVISDEGTSAIHTKTLQELSKIVEELEAGLEDKQFVLVGDLMQYELSPVLESYKEEITKLEM
ncbi:hypothetical protein M3201_14610 [Paenibacillus motobuensis]|uniref:hypothetical protein n=1 Tax=Paenibacillus TaxID=44249 RepID=UPI00203BF745|nr:MULTISPECIES: hypothetical protein [Paenibacillus]MCM3040932.1 hypothetical protein [Paenibacillus lutimineralis]MCM3648036.1 hypothetical protein [Paenibacillus motobuensis]